MDQMVRGEIAVRGGALDEQIQRQPLVDVWQNLGGLGEFDPRIGRRRGTLGHGWGLCLRLRLRASGGPWGIERIEIGPLLRRGFGFGARIGLWFSGGRLGEGRRREGAGHCGSVANHGAAALLAS